MKMEMKAMDAEAVAVVTLRSGGREGGRVEYCHGD